ncbi:MAG: CHASE2 domain-containing protein, partial [bacterium]|nr:CHASE2 domain-containing protein [bacterium]
MKKLRTIFTVIFSILIFSVIYYLTYNLAEPKAYDFMTKTLLTNKFSFDKNKKVYGSDDIILVIIDDKTCEKYSWPWAREDLCDIFNYFTKYAKPKVMVHDSILSNPDSKNPESDKKYFNTLKGVDNLVEGFVPLATPWENENQGKAFEKIFIPTTELQIDNRTTDYIPHIYESIITMPYEYINSVKGFGSVSSIPGAINGDILVYDNITRNQEYIFNYKGSYLPSLALKTFLVANNNPKIVLSDKYIEFPELNYKIQYAKSL